MWILVFCALHKCFVHDLMSAWGRSCSWFEPPTCWTFFPTPANFTVSRSRTETATLFLYCVWYVLFIVKMIFFFFFDILIKGIINNYLLPCLPLIKKIIIMKLFIKSKTILFNVNSCLGQPVFTSCAFFFLCTFSFVHTHMRW